MSEAGRTGSMKDCTLKLLACSLFLPNGRLLPTLQTHIGQQLSHVVQYFEYDRLTTDAAKPNMQASPNNKARNDSFLQTEQSKDQTRMTDQEPIRHAKDSLGSHVRAQVFWESGYAE